MLTRKSVISLAATSLFLYGCSGLVESTRKNLLGDSSPRKKIKKEVKWVSKAQYDDLMVKYRNLSQRYEKLKDDNLSGNSGFNQIDELTSQTAPANTNAETVDVFGNKGMVAPTKPKARPSVAVTPAPRVQISEGKFDQNLDYYKKAVALRANGKDDEALKIFQFLDKESSRQIQVRSKRHIGDIYFSKGQFDLALQVYEDIIRKYSFSGKVIKALEGAVRCSAKLGLNEKKIRYESILRDFFEVQV